MKAYIAGPITNNPDYENSFIDAEIDLKDGGWEVINSVRVTGSLPSSTTHDEYMKLCLTMVDMADAIYLLSGWETSKGACIEYGYALGTEKIILFEGGKINVGN